jgi:hypothetical protein
VSLVASLRFCFLKLILGTDFGLVLEISSSLRASELIFCYFIEVFVLDGGLDSSGGDGGSEREQNEFRNVGRGSRLRDAVHPRLEGPGRGVAGVPAVVRARRADAEARDDRALLHDEPRSVAPEVSAPGVAEAEGKAQGRDVQSDTGGLGRLRHALGERDRRVVQLPQVASLPANDCQGLGSGASCSVPRARAAHAQARQVLWLFHRWSSSYRSLLQVIFSFSCSFCL